MKAKRIFVSKLQKARARVIAETSGVFEGAIKACWRNWRYTLAAALTLSLGIASNLLIFSIVDVLLIRPLMYPRAEQLVRIGEVKQKDDAESGSASYPAFAAIRDHNNTFINIAAYRHQNFTVRYSGLAEQVEGVLVTPQFFDVLGLKPQIGRNFNQLKDEHIVIISQRLNARVFSSGTGIIGTMITVNGAPHLIAGIMPATFRYPSNEDIWVPVDSSVPEQREEMSSSETRRFAIIARLKADVTIFRAKNEMAALEPQIANLSSKPSAGWTLSVAPFRDDIVGTLRPTVLILFGAVGFILAIACANVGSLALAHSIVRRREMAIRIALGASRLRIVLQILTESVCVASIGSIIGTLLALLSLHSIIALSPTDLPFASEIAVSFRVLVFAASLAVFVGILFGLVPAIALVKNVLNPTLEDNAWSTQGTRKRHWLVSAELGLSLVLLCGATLLIKSFVALHHIDPGFRDDHLLITHLERPIPQNPSPDGNYELWTGFQERVLAQIQSSAAIEGAAATTAGPLEGHRWLVQFRGDWPTPADADLVAEERIVSQNYLEMMKIPLHRGRYFTRQDTRNTSRVVIVNQAFLERYFPVGDPIGRQIEEAAFGIGKSEIIGVVGNVHLNEKPSPELYHVSTQVPFPYMAIFVRTKTEPMVYARPLAQVVSILDPQQTLGAVLTFENMYADTTQYLRFQTVMLSVFAGLALLLVTVGIYSLTAYSVSRNTREIGVRVALGASRIRILVLLISQVGVRVAVGIALGVPTAIAVGYALHGTIYGVGLNEPSVYVLASVLLTITVLGGALIPAIRATRIDPAVALRL